jgi:hypothetical protein
MPDPQFVGTFELTPVSPYLLATMAAKPAQTPRQLELIAAYETGSVPTLPARPLVPRTFQQPPIAKVRKMQRSPDKQASIERRRRLARASPVPPELVDKFTQAEHAVLTVVCGEIQRCGACDWPLAKTAAMAGTCRTVVRTAMRKAREHELLFVKERRRRGQKSDTNIVRALRRRWGAWLKWIGVRKRGTTTDKVLGNAEWPPVEVSQCGLLAGTGLRGGP